MISNAAIHDLGVAPHQRSRVLVGIALSLTVHAVLLLAYRFGALPKVDNDSPQRVAIEVRLVAPPPPVALPEPIPEPAPTRQAKADPAPKRPRAVAKPAPTELIAVPQQAARAAPFTVAPSEEAPRFDPEAARKLARKMANEPDPARAGTAVAQLPPKPYETETKAARVISRAKRADCRDQFATGSLLTPLGWLLDGKDSGCKF